jgi:hypothetical protein
MNKIILALFLSAFSISGCVVVPAKDSSHSSKCEISSDRKTLRIVDVAKETNSYYSISGMVLLPVSGVVSGVYVAINNVYNLGEEKIVCE